MDGILGVGKAGGPVIALTREKIVLVDLALLVMAFFAANYAKRGGLMLPGGYFELLIVFMACWMTASLVGKKFQAGKYRTFRSGARVIVKSNLYLGYTISFVIVFFGLGQYSRIQVFSTCLFLLLLNAGLWLAGHRLTGVSDDVLEKEAPTESVLVGNGQFLDYRMLVTDLVLLVTSFWTVNYMKRGHLALLPGYDKLLLILIALWFVVSLATGKFLTIAGRNAYYVFWQWQKAGLMMLAGMAVGVFALRLFYFSRFQGFGTVLLLMILEVLLLVIVLSGRKAQQQADDVESAEQVRQIWDQAPVDTNVDIEAIRRQLMAPAEEKLEERMKAAGSGVFAFLSNHIPLTNILWLETVVEQSCEPVIRQPQMADVPWRLFINLHKLNDVRRLNQYYLEVYQNLLAGGYFVGYAHTIQTHYDWVHGKFPRLLAHLVYGVDFLFKRIMPKLPWTKNLYFAITKGKNRVISRAEVLGRLSFCGFEIVAEQEVDRRFWVIARKVKKPSLVQNPTYGPLVVLNRTGYQGEAVRVYKLRTMHPYSEFLQDYVFEQQGLREGGKLKDDFRVTSWGRWFRKLWIDELPMLYNWLKGDLKIVGVRPLSSHYLGLYDEELRQLRLQTKPGLIPPFYVDLPETFEEICESERKYLQAYMEKPVRTDIYYGAVALWNIFVKKARSG